MTARRNNEVSRSLASAPNTRLRVLNMQLRPSCIWHGLLWFMPPYIGLSFAVKHLVWVYNHVPNVWSGLTPLELITRERSDYKDLLCCHVWGCPVFVLEAKL